MGDAQNVLKMHVSTSTTMLRTSRVIGGFDNLKWFYHQGGVLWGPSFQGGGITKVHILKFMPLLTRPPPVDFAFLERQRETQTERERENPHPHVYTWMVTQYSVGGPSQNSPIRGPYIFVFGQKENFLYHINVFGTTHQPTVQGSYKYNQMTSFDNIKIR